MFQSLPHRHPEKHIYLRRLCDALPHFAPQLKPTETLLVRLVEAQLNAYGADKVTWTLSHEEAAALTDVLAKMVVRRQENRPLTTIDY